MPDSSAARSTPLPAAPDLRDSTRGLLRSRWDVLLAIAAGGAVGSLARWGVAAALPHDGHELPWSTVLENVPGALLLGVLMVFVVDVWPPTRWVRPFLGVGVLGGYTTFSTYMLDTRDLLAGGEAVLALTYLFGTLVVGLLAVWLGIVLARVWVALTRARRQHGTDRKGSRR